MKKIIVIGAVSQDGVYGVGNQIPWQIKAELQHFYVETVRSTVIMGRRTWELIPEKVRPLPGRLNKVVTSRPDYEAKGAAVYTSLEDAIDAAKTEKVFCIGGLKIWYEAMEFADEAIITVVRMNCDTLGALKADELLDPTQKWPRFRRAPSGVVHVGGDFPFDINRWIRM